MNLVQTDGEVSAKVAYLIVDQKQDNVFYRLYSDVYENIYAEPRVLSADGSSPPPCSYGPKDWDVPNGELQSIHIDFVEDMFNPQPPSDEEYIAEFEFLLEF